MRSYCHLALWFLAAIVWGCSPINADGAVGGKETLKPREEAPNKALNLQGLSINTTEWYVDIDARICLEEGMLELVACTKGTKEHESIVAVEATARDIHAALLLLGAEAGRPAHSKSIGNSGTMWVPVPPSGGKVDVFLVSKDEKSGKSFEKPIREFMVNEDGETFPTHTFLFAGSELIPDKEGGAPQYLADRSGNVMSITTFGDEVLCLPDIRSHDNAALNWSLAGSKLPGIGTQVTLRLRPQTAPKESKPFASGKASTSVTPPEKPTEHVPTKVFILAGQSNMQGQGVVSMDHPQYYNEGKGNLEWSMKHSESALKMKHLKDEHGNWVERKDVQISYKSKDEHRKGNLTVGYTGYGGSSHIGPELQFGHVVGDYFEEPVFLIKTAWGGKSLHVDFRPPSSGGQVGPYYTQMIEEIHAALDGLGQVPYELAGFVWMQGWNDMVTKPAIPEYASNLVNLAKDVRKEFNAHQLPFIVGELGNGGPAIKESNMAEFRKAQREGTARMEYAAFVETTAFARPKERSPNITHGHHWYGNAESYFLIGDALAKAAIDLIQK
jgi:hypothetical protein